MMAVWKFPLRLTAGPQKVEMPVGATIIHVHAQAGNVGGDRPVMWATVRPVNPTQTRTFHVVATGEEYGLPISRYTGTVHLGRTVWHVIEDRSA